MSVKRFVAADMRRALELVRQEMGADAIILSSKRVKGGVEILTSNDPYYQSVAETPSRPSPAMHSQHSSGTRRSSIPEQTDDELMMETPMSSDMAWGQESIMGRLMAKQDQDELQQRERHDSFNGRAQQPSQHRNQHQHHNQHQPRQSELNSQVEQGSFASTLSQQYAAAETAARENYGSHRDRVDLSIDGQAKAQQIARAQRQKARSESLTESLPRRTNRDEIYEPRRFDGQQEYSPKVLHESQPTYSKPSLNKPKDQPTQFAPHGIRDERAPMVNTQPYAEQEAIPEQPWAASNVVNFDDFQSYPEASQRWKKDLGLPRLTPKKRNSTQDEYFSMMFEKPGSDVVSEDEGVAAPIAESAQVIERKDEVVAEPVARNQFPPVVEEAGVAAQDEINASTIEAGIDQACMDKANVGNESIANERIVKESTDEANPDQNSASAEIVNADINTLEKNDVAEQPQPSNLLQLGSFTYEQSEADIIFHLDPNTYVTPAANDTEDVIEEEGVYIDEIFDEQFCQLKDEIGDMREFLRNQLAAMSEQSAAQAREAERKVAEQAKQFAEEKAQLVEERRAKIVGNTMKTTIKRRLQQLGMSDASISKCLNDVSSDRSLHTNWANSLATISHDIPVVGRDLISDGGFYAFVGPSGAGKTATVSKLASRYVLEHGSRGVALVTMSSPDSGGNHRLQRLGSILNVPVYEANESNKLEYILQDLADHRLVLIDTEGANCQDTNLKSQLSELRRLPQVDCMLVLSANTQVQLLKSATHNFKRANIRGCVITKLDETASLGEVLGVLINAEIPVAYTTHGASMPQEVTIARAHQLITKAVSLLKENGQRYVKSKKILSHKSAGRRDSSSHAALQRGGDGNHQAHGLPSNALRSKELQRAVAP